MEMWHAKVGGEAALPANADGLLRHAVSLAYEALTGARPAFLFSGRSNVLSDGEAMSLGTDKIDNAQDPMRTIPAHAGSMELQHAEGCMCSYPETAMTKLIDARCIVAYHVPVEY